MKEVYDDTRKKNENALAALKKEFNSVRTGRASLNLLEGITVEYYGTLTPLNQVATLTVPEPRLIIIQPWDAGIIKEVEKAILRSDLGLTPSNDGKIVRVPVPSLTEERRKQLVKVVKRIAEECKVAIRNVRRDGIDSLKKMEKDGKISYDDFYKAQEDIQKITDDYVNKAEEMLSNKEREILEV